MVVCSFLAPLRPFLDCGLALVDPPLRLVPAAPLLVDFDWSCDDAGLELLAAAAACRAELLVAIAMFTCQVLESDDAQLMAFDEVRESVSRVYGQ